MSQQIREQGYVIKHKDEDSFYGENMLEDYTMGEPSYRATIFETKEKAEKLLNWLNENRPEENHGIVKTENYEIRRIERRVMWRII